jgi:hypothetical protein
MGRRLRATVGLIGLGAPLVIGSGCSEGGGSENPLDPSNSSVSTDSTSPAAIDQGDDPAASRDNVDEDRDDSGAGAPSDPNSDEGSNSGGGSDADD